MWADQLDGGIDRAGSGIRPRPGIDSGSIHVWRFPLDAADDVLPRLAATLSADERERASRFRFERDRARYQVGRATLRQILGHYQSVAPSDIRFEYLANGKPVLTGPFTDGAATDVIAASIAPLDFNLAHSAAWGLCAVSTAGPVGVDIERIRADFDCEPIAQDYFAPPEAADILACAPEGRPARFFEYWTRKESYIKGLGVGLSMDLNRFWFAPESAGSPLWRVHPIFDESAPWRTIDLNSVPGFTAALSVCGEPTNALIGEWVMDGPTA